MTKHGLTAYVGSRPSTGSIVKSSYVERHLMVYGILEYEAERLSNLSTVAILSFSFGSLLLSIPIGIYVSWAFANQLSVTAGLIIHVIAPALVLATLFFYALGTVLIYQRRGLWARIKEQSIAR